jgi:cytochrome c oxidase assembly protein subunit 15
VLLGALALTAWFLRRDRPAAVLGAAGLESLALLAVTSTMVVGATGSLAALADTLFPAPSLPAALAADFAANSPLLIRMRWVHPAAAVVGLICAVLLAMLVRTALSRVVLGLLVAQMLLGLADVLLLAPTWMQVVHLLGADLYWVALTCLAAEIVWPAEPLTA